MFTIALRIAGYVLGGVGLTHIFDRVVTPVLPEPIRPAPIAPSFGIKNILWFVATMVIGALITKWLGKKFNIQILK